MEGLWEAALEYQKKLDCPHYKIVPRGALFGGTITASLKLILNVKCDLFTVRMESYTTKKITQFQHFFDCLGAIYTHRWSDQVKWLT